MAAERTRLSVGTELTAADRPAIFTFSSLHLELDGSLLGIEPVLFFSEAAQGVDATDYAVSIAAVAVPALSE